MDFQNPSKRPEIWLQESLCHPVLKVSTGKAFVTSTKKAVLEGQEPAKSPLSSQIQKLEALAEVLAWISCGSLDTKSRAFTNLRHNDAQTNRHLISVAPDMQISSSRVNQQLRRLFTSVSSACWHFLWGSRCGEFTPVFKAQPQGKSGSRENPKSLLSQETNCHSWALR